MKKALALIVFAFVLVPVVAFGAQVEGSIQGYNCVTQGKVCPIGKEDPMAAVERVFVLYTDKKDFFFIPNVDRVVLARHIANKVRITGEKNPMFKSITATKIEVWKKGGWKETWSDESEKEIRKFLGMEPSM